MTTSAVFTRSANICRPRSCLRLRVTPFLFALSRTKKCESRSARSESPRRAGSPAGGSILMTSAPSQPSSSVQLGPASYCVRSRMRMPSSALLMIADLLCRVRREADGGGARLVVRDDVDHRRLARGPRALKRRADVVGLLHVLSVGAHGHGHLVPAGIAQVAAGLVSIRIGGPAAVVADDHQHGNVVPDGAVDLVA